MFKKWYLGSKSIKTNAIDITISVITILIDRYHYEIPTRLRDYLSLQLQLQILLLQCNLSNISSCYHQGLKVGLTFRRR